MAPLLFSSNGGVAQLGERCVRNAEVKSSILSVSTRKNDRFQPVVFLNDVCPFGQVMRTAGVMQTCGS